MCCTTWDKATKSLQSEKDKVHERIKLGVSVMMRVLMRYQKFKFVLDELFPSHHYQYFLSLSLMGSKKQW